MNISNVEKIRWDRTRLQRRILTSDWKNDVIDRLTKRMSSLRREDLGDPVTALNLYKSLVGQIAIIYDREPSIDNLDKSSAMTGQIELMNVILNEAFWAQFLAQNCSYTIGLRENFIKVVQVESGLRLGLVTPDTVIIKTAPYDPEKIVELRELILRDGKEYWLVWNIERDPRHFIMDENGEDVSNNFRDEFPPDYEWIDSNGNAFIPFIKYRARYTEKNFEPEFWEGLVDGTLDTAVLWTMYFSQMIDASWPQKYAVDVELPGASTKRLSTGENLSFVNPTPTSILMFKTVQRPDARPLMGQFQPGFDPSRSVESILSFQIAVLANAGVNPADVEESHVAQSGVAIQLKMAARRREALSYIPSFRIADENLLNLIAKCFNIYNPTVPQLSETGWKINYVLPELSETESTAIVNQNKDLVAAGLSSKVDAILKIKPELKTREQAIEYLKMVQSENAILNSESNNNESDNN
jgi:hypothetical protein